MRRSFLGAVAALRLAGRDTFAYIHTSLNRNNSRHRFRSWRLYWIRLAVYHFTAGTLRISRINAHLIRLFHYFDRALSHFISKTVAIRLDGLGLSISLLLGCAATHGLLSSLFIFSFYMTHNIVYLFFEVSDEVLDVSTDGYVLDVVPPVSTSYCRFRSAQLGVCSVWDFAWSSRLSRKIIDALFKFF